MLRRPALLSLLVLFAAHLNPLVAASDAELMAAARAADDVFQRSLALTYADLTHPDQAKVIAAIRTLGRLDVAEAVPVLLPLADGYHQPPAVLLAACETLADLNAVVATGALQQLLEHTDASVRAGALKALTRLQAMGTPHYLQRGRDADDAVRASAVTSLGAMEAGDAAALLTEALRYDPRPHIRRMAAIGLGRLGDSANAEVLIESLSDSDPGVRHRCAEALALLDVKRSIPFLIMALEANVSATQINHALVHLSGQDFGFDTRANILDRQRSIESAFEWWAMNAKSLQQ